jgi:hypothetical protein
MSMPAVQPVLGERQLWCGTGCEATAIDSRN